MYNIHMKKILVKKINRSGLFPCDICGDKTFLDSHHIEGRKIQNFNKLSNLTKVCQSCHRKVHEGKIIIEGWFSTTEGMKLLWHNSGEKSISGQKRTPFIIPK